MSDTEHQLETIIEKEKPVQMEEENEDVVELNEGAKWLQSVFNAPGFSKWRADKALEEGKSEKFVLNLLMDYNMKMKRCNDIADFITEYCDPRDALKKKPLKKNPELEQLKKKANQKFWAVMKKGKEEKKPKKEEN